MLSQVLAITGINIKSIPERWASSLVIVVGLAGVVAVFTALLAMESGFESTLKATGRQDAVIILRGGSDAELNSGLDRTQTDLIEQGDGIRLGADGRERDKLRHAIDDPDHGGRMAGRQPVRALGDRIEHRADIRW